MSEAIENRIVQMKFSNRAFEKGVANSLKSLYKLDEAMQFKNAEKGARAIDNAMDQVSFKKIEDGIESLNDKFSMLRIVAINVLSDLATTATRTVIGTMNAAFNQIKSGGLNRAMNLEHAKFQIEGLGKAWEDVGDDINYAVDGTAYGLDAAAVAASQLLASNVQVGDEMKAALRGISGVAAMTSSSYEEIANVFTAVAGQGKVMAINLNSLSARGINAAATLADAMGVTEAEVRDMVSEGKIDFNTFAKAMDDAYGEHAKDANKTFTGALSNMKAALSRIGADVETPGLENARDIFNALRESINAIHEAMMPLINDINNLQNHLTKVVVKAISARNLIDIWKGFYSVIKQLVKIGKQFSMAFSNVFGKLNSKMILGITKSFEKFFKSFKLNGPALYNIYEIFFEFFTLLKNVGKYLSLIFSISFDKVLNKIGIAIKLITRALNGIMNGFLKAFNFKRVKSALEFLNMALYRLKKAFTINSKAMYPVYAMAFKIFAAIRRIMVALSPLVKVLTKVLVKVLQIIFKTVRNIIHYIYALTKSISPINSILKSIGKIAIALANAVGDAIIKLLNITNRRNNIEPMINMIKNGLKFISNSLGIVTPLVVKFINSISKSKAASIGFTAISKSLDIMSAGFEVLYNVANKVRQLIKSVFSNLKTSVEKTTFFKSLDESFGKLKDTFSNGADNITKLLKRFAKWIGEIDISKAANAISNGFSKIINAVSNFFDLIEKPVTTGFSKAIGIIVVGFMSVKKAAKTAISGLKSFTKHINDIFTQNNNEKVDGLGYISQGLANFEKDAKKLYKSLGPTGKAIMDMFGSQGIIGIVSNALKLINKFIKRTNPDDIWAFIDMNLLVKLSNSIESIIKSINGVEEPLVGLQEALSPGKIMQIAVAIGMLAGALYVISQIDTAKIFITIGAIAALMVLIGGFVTLLSYLNTLSNFDFSGISSITSDILKISLGLLVMAVALKVLASLGDSVWPALGALAALAIILLGFTIALAKLIPFTAGLGKVVLCILALASAMVIGAIAANLINLAILGFIGILKLLSTDYFKDIDKGVARLSYILKKLFTPMLMFTIILALLAVEFVVVSVGMLLFGIGMALIAKQAVKVISIIASFAAFIMMIASLKVSALIKVIVGLIAIGIALNLIGKGALLAGIGVQKFGIGVLAVAAAFMLFLQALLLLDESFVKLKDIIGHLFQFIGGLVGDFILALPNFLLELLDKVANTLKRGLKVLAKILRIIFNFLLNFVEHLNWQRFGRTIAKMLIEMWIGIVDYMYSKKEKIRKTLVKFIELFYELFVNVIGDIFDDICDVLGLNLDGLWELLGSAFATIIDTLGDFWSGVAKAFEKKGITAKAKALVEFGVNFAKQVTGQPIIEVPSDSGTSSGDNSGPVKHSTVANGSAVSKKNGKSNKSNDTTRKKANASGSAVSAANSDKQKKEKDYSKAISGLGDKLNKIYNKNTNLYMDGDVLVGGLSDKFDSSLGTTSIFKERGI